MSLLSAIQDASVELGVKYPSFAINNSDLIIRQLVSYANDTGNDLRDSYLWPQLKREKVFTLVASTASYALPDDFDREIFNSHWDTSNNWQILGPATDAEWAEYQSGLSTLTPRKLFKVEGVTDSQFKLLPTPSTSEAGQTISFRYISRSWCRPATWATGTTYANGSYTFYNGNYYYASVGGVAGATAPTHTSGSASDGTISWAFIDDPYESFLKDTDVCLFGDRLIKLGVKWRFRAGRRLDFSEEKRQFDSAVENTRSKLEGAAVIRLGRTGNSFLLGSDNIPDSNIG